MFTQSKFNKYSRVISGVYAEVLKPIQRPNTKLCILVALHITQCSDQRSLPLVAQSVNKYQNMNIDKVCLRIVFLPMQLTWKSPW